MCVCVSVGSAQNVCKPALTERQFFKKTQHFILEWAHYARRSHPWERHHISKVMSHPLAQALLWFRFIRSCISQFS